MPGAQPAGAGYPRTGGHINRPDLSACAALHMAHTQRPRHIRECPLTHPYCSCCCPVLAVSWVGPAGPAECGMLMHQTHVFQRWTLHRSCPKHPKALLPPHLGAAACTLLRLADESTLGCGVVCGSAVDLGMSCGLPLEDAPHPLAPPYGGMAQLLSWQVMHGGAR